MFLKPCLEIWQPCLEIWHLDRRAGYSPEEVWSALVSWPCIFHSANPTLGKSEWQLQWNNVCSPLRMAGSRRKLSICSPWIREYSSRAARPVFFQAHCLVSFQDLLSEQKESSPTIWAGLLPVGQYLKVLVHPIVFRATHSLCDLAAAGLETSIWLEQYTE